jgi:hypothetical protein
MMRNKIKVGDKIKIKDSKLPHFGDEFFILFKVYKARDFYSYGRNKNQVFADGYCGSKQFEIV